MTVKQAKVKQDDENPIAVEVLAAAIVTISMSFKKLLKSGLNRRAVVALIRDDTSLGKGTIEVVLDSLENLANAYTK